MPTIDEVKREITHQEWAAQVMECRSSGMQVKEWCKVNGVNINSYYRHLRIVRKELLDKVSELAQKIIPISVATEINEKAMIPIKSQSPNDTKINNVVMRKDGLEIELPQNISEKMLLTLLRGLKQC